MRAQSEKVFSESDGEVDDEVSGASEDGSVQQLTQLQSRKRKFEVETENMDEQLNKLLSRAKSRSASRSQPQSKQQDTGGITSILRDYEVEDETGDEVEGDLALLIETMAKGQLSEANLDKKMTLHKRPQNCNFWVPRVNSEVWSIMDHGAKTSDLKVQKRQKNLLTAVCALTKVAQTCVAGATLDSATVLNSVTDAMGLIFKAVSDLPMDRRGKILNAPQVNKKYRKVVSTEIPVTKQLFGDYLKAAFASIDSSSKLGMAFTMSSRGKKYFPRGTGKKMDSPRPVGVD